MATPAIPYATVTARLDHPVDAVWARVGSFGGLQHWAAGVSACSVDGEGVGAVRTVIANGAEVRERLEAIDPAAHTLRYRILSPHRMPADNVHGNIALRALDAGSTEMIWHSDATDFTAAPDVVGARIEAFYRASIAGLERLLETDA